MDILEEILGLQLEPKIVQISGACLILCLRSVVYRLLSFVDSLVIEIQSIIHISYAVYLQPYDCREDDRTSW